MGENEKSIVLETKVKRSPSFPVMPIDEAIDRIGRVYREDRRAFTTFENVATHIGYTSTKKGGRTGRAVSALKQYGLLDERAGQYRVSDSAFKILEMPEDSAERAELIKKAALSPPIFRKILKIYEGQLPSDATIRSHLIFKEGFNPDSIRDFIRILRRTIELVNPVPADYTDGEESEEADELPFTGAPPMQQTPATSPGQGRAAQSPAAPPIPPAGSTHTPLEPGESVLAFKISRDSEARVIFKGQVTQEAIEKLAALLDLSKDAYPTKAELEQPRRAIWRNKDHDQPVTVTGEAGEHDGRRYVSIEGSAAGVPEDELEYQ